LLFDLPLQQLREYRPTRDEPPDFDAFWADTLAEARRYPFVASFEPFDIGLSTVESFDVSFAGYGRQSVRGWLLLPAARTGGCRAVTSSRAAELAPHRRAHPRSRGRACRALRLMDDRLLSPPTNPAGDGEALLVVRLIFGSAMLTSIGLAVFAITRRDFPSHGAWMTRGYAIALGTGTPRQHRELLVFGPIGAADELPRMVLMTAGWVINLAVAEYVIRRRPGHRSNRTSAGLGRPGTADALVA
jgi:hypothetical protein